MTPKGISAFSSEIDSSKRTVRQSPNPDVVLNDNTQIAELKNQVVHHQQKFTFHVWAYLPSISLVWLWMGLNRLAIPRMERESLVWRAKGTMPTALNIEKSVIVVVIVVVVIRVIVGGHVVVVDLLLVATSPLPSRVLVAVTSSSRVLVLCFHRRVVVVPHHRSVVVLSLSELCWDEQRRVVGVSRPVSHRATPQYSIDYRLRRCFATRSLANARMLGVFPDAQADDGADYWSIPSKRCHIAWETGFARGYALRVVATLRAIAVKVALVTRKLLAAAAITATLRTPPPPMTHILAVSMVSGYIAGVALISQESDVRSKGFQLVMTTAHLACLCRLSRRRAA
ncbi:uncharacterized protein LACBIDRAFT_296027 [Laccaria bicolor S238N-H82]|uniref:Predicted protein n=1 Tax=Laccaria bicolor (strain S238N-H82 / ATCC MYA-4686) TaxID=486041 RepID=B0E209_LACBS|nr:uncharacterized protein LACBIDRAFT_296027 [Laccaria bicolor S238N-H82]EDQ99089.1 predicted protein [Laccaria bicolor S238N-H82]|eukprot:XP_001890222.1 predicted protein [Laccaria bicolor S238N-H82]